MRLFQRGRVPLEVLGKFVMPLFLAIFRITATAEGATCWTSVEGVTIQAGFAGFNGNHVILFWNGRHHQVPISRLTPASAAQARSLMNEPLDIEHAVDATPSSAVYPKELGEKIPRDRHGMPIYPYYARVRVVRTTAYSCGEIDHLIYGSRNALGSPLKYGAGMRSAAADWSVYPAGTTFRITGLPWLYVVDDYGSALVGTGTIDIYHPDTTQMRRWGRRNVEVTIVHWGALGQSARILAGRTRHDHCRQMFDAINRLCAAMRLVASR